MYVFSWMNVNLIVVPYDSGRRDFRMGSGPGHLLRNGLAAQLEAGGHVITVTTLETVGNDVESAFDLAAKIAATVRAADRNGHLPVILAGNCVASLGGFAGLRSRTAMLWLDAHADFNTPDTSPSGFLDGMALAIITGRGFRELSQKVAGFDSLPESDLVMLGTREVDPGEQAIMDGLSVVRNAADLAASLNVSAKSELYLHVDLDVLDPAALRANGFASANGLTRRALIESIAKAAATKRVAALAITAYDPQFDRENHGPDIVLEIIGTVLNENLRA
jgi:arginase